MPSKTPKLRGSPGLRHGPWPLGEIPDGVIFRVGKCLVHHQAFGTRDLSGDEFGDIVAYSVQGDHRAKPLGVADVVWNGCGWSVKTVKAPAPHDTTRIRLISGRTSPDFSLNISDPRKDVQATGRAVLAIWNQRVRESLNRHDELRLMVLIRNIEAQECVLFEDDIARFPADNYTWTVNKNKNLEGKDRSTGQHSFTWQPHGSQLTIIRSVPGSARLFSINRVVPKIDREHVWNSLGCDDTWIDILPKET